jgi:hypothetical protein
VVIDRASSRGESAGGTHGVRGGKQANFGASPVWTPLLPDDLRPALDF